MTGRYCARCGHLGHMAEERNRCPLAACPHDDPRCPHGPACRLERCSGCDREYHVLGARGFRSSCCEARMVPAAVVTREDSNTAAPPDFLNPPHRYTYTRRGLWVCEPCGMIIQNKDCPPNEAWHRPDRRYTT